MPPVLNVSLQYWDSGRRSIREISVRPTTLLELYAGHCSAPPPKPGRALIQVDPASFRPTEVEALLGDPSKARAKLGWSPETSFDELVLEMFTNYINEAGRDSVCRRSGFPRQESYEAQMVGTKW